MTIVAIRTDKPEAEIALFEDSKLLAEKKWKAHRQLAETLHLEIANLLQNSGKDWQDIGGVIVYKGPGSFTGLRIGMSVANALSMGLNIKLAAETGQDWIDNGVEKLMSDKGEDFGQIDYGAPAHITHPKK